MGIKVLFIYPNTYGMNMLPPAIAGLELYDEKLLNNCYTTPYIATFTTETRNKMELACSKKLINFLRK